MKSYCFWCQAVSMAIAACLVQGVCSAREWVSNDGRKLVADFVSATATEVTVIRLSDRKEFTLMLRTLSEADQKWVAENSGAIGAGSSNLRLGMEVGNETEDGTYSKHFTGKWVMAEYRDLPYAIYAGEKLDSSKKYPLILGLHGKSDNNENGKQTGILGKFTGSPPVRENSSYSSRATLLPAVWRNGWWMG